MDIPFEAKYLNIVWQDKSHARKVTESDTPLEVTQISAEHYQLEVISYSKIENNRQGQFAVRFLTNDSKLKPYFMLKDGERAELLPVKDPITGLIWWIKGDVWEFESWQSRIYRSVGSVKLRVGAIQCDINICASTFSYDQLECYLSSFRNDFWELILDDSSYIMGAGKLSVQDEFNESALAAVTKFLRHVEKLLLKPKVELRESQRLLPRNKNRPVPRTFMELSTKGDGRFLTSRTFDESLDVPENRYVHYAIKKVYILIRILASVAINYSERGASNISAYQQRLASFSDIKLINEEAVRNDFREKQDRLERINETLSKQFNVGGVDPTHDQNSWSLCVNLGKPTGWEESNSYLVNVRMPNKMAWFDSGNGFVTMHFDNEVEVESGYEYELTGNIVTSNAVTRAGKNWYQYHVSAVHRLRVIGGWKYDALVANIESMKVQIEKLEMSGWSRPLSNDEREQQNREIRSINKILERLHCKEKNMSRLVNELQPKIPLFKQILKRFKVENVGISDVFPSSMSFIHNIHYQGAHSNYKIIREASGAADDEILLSMQRIEEISLVNVSLLYERWCLLQIIKVLVQRYGYKPEQDWKRKLIKKILENGTNVAISFSNEEASRRVKLWYELSLDNGNRPDFILDVEADHCDAPVLLTKRFVLDAKFYQDIDHKRHKGISGVIDHLYHDKDYSEDGKNAVFILHPSKGAVPKRLTPQNWAANSFYGEVEMFDWDKEMRDTHSHEYGAIYLSPVGQFSYLDDLQRVVGMFLQYGIEDNKLEGGSVNPIPSAKIFCIVCGSVKYDYESKTTNAGVKWWITCRDCSHFTVYNYCGSPKCRNRLIKNGDYWTYHSTEPLNSVNIKCPPCGSKL